MKALWIVSPLYFSILFFHDPLKKGYTLTWTGQPVNAKVKRYKTQGKKQGPGFVRTTSPSDESSRFWSDFAIAPLEVCQV